MIFQSVPALQFDLNVHRLLGAKLDWSSPCYSLPLPSDHNLKPMGVTENTVPEQKVVQPDLIPQPDLSPQSNYHWLDAERSFDPVLLQLNYTQNRIAPKQQYLSQ